MKNSQLFLLINHFCKLAGQDFLSEDERGNYFDADYIDELARRAESAKLNINKCIGELSLLPYGGLLPHTTGADTLREIINTKNNKKNNKKIHQIKLDLISAVTYYFAGIYSILRLNLNVSDFNLAENIIKLDIKRIPVEKIAQLIKNIDTLYLSAPGGNELNWYLEEIPAIVGLSVRLKQILVLFDIRDFDSYFEQIIPDLKDLLKHVASYNNIDVGGKESIEEKEKFDDWAQDAIAETQLHGEYRNHDDGDERNLTWEDLDEEDKLRLLERGNRPLYNKFHFSE